jgi:hypothetical protein
MTPTPTDSGINAGIALVGVFFLVVAVLATTASEPVAGIACGVVGTGFVIYAIA